MRIAFLHLLAGAAMLVAAACSPAGVPTDVPPAALVERSRVSMGSEVRLTAWTTDEANALLAFEHIFEDFDYLDRLLSVWHEQSQITRVNEAAGREPIKVRGEVIDLLVEAQRYSELTGGKFDMTFGALSGLWKFDHDQDDSIPPRAAVQARLPLVDYRDVGIDTDDHTVFLRRQGMRIHLGGIGKGFAVDRAAAMLRSHGIDDFLIQAGGDMYASGRRGDRPWRAAIRDPRGEGVIAALALRNETFSTSGDYERFFIRDGQRYHHILDPDTGEPARGAQSVTIVADRAVTADALSTGVFIMGPDRGMALVEDLPDVEAVIVTAAGEVRVSSGLRQRLEVSRR